MLYRKDIAEKNLALLKIKCERGIYHDRLFKAVINGRDEYYPVEKLEWMKKYVSDDNALIGASCMECLCRHGVDIVDFKDYVKENFDKPYWCNKAIEIAENQDDPDFILMFLEESSIYMNRAILALKRNNHETYLTALLLSDDDNLVKTVMRMTKCQKPDTLS